MKTWKFRGVILSNHPSGVNDGCIGCYFQNKPESEGCHTEEWYRITSGRGCTMTIYKKISLSKLFKKL
jgi:hypothetical protein